MAHDELKLLIAKQGDLAKAILSSQDMQLLANEMNSECILPDYTHEDVRSMCSENDKADIIVKALRRKVDVNRGYFEKFVNILRRHERKFHDILYVLGYSDQCQSPPPPSTHPYDTTRPFGDSLIHPQAGLDSSGGLPQPNLAHQLASNRPTTDLIVPPTNVSSLENRVTSVQPQESFQNIHLTPDIKEDLEQQLECNFKMIVDQYAAFVSCIRKSIDRNGDVSVEDLRSYLLNKSAFDHDNQQVMLLSDVKNELQEAATIHAIFDFLSVRFASFLNYDIFKSIVQEFGNDKDHQKLEDYTARLEEYVNKHKISEFFNINPALKEYDKTAKKLILKVDYEKFQKLAKITNLKRALADIWDLKTSAIQFYGIEDGCILVIFLIPVCVADVIFVEENRSTILKQAGCFQALSVQWLECDGFKVYFERSSPDDIKDSEEGVSDCVLESIDPSLTVKKNLPLAGTTLSEQSRFYKDESSTDSTDPPSSKYQDTTVSTEQSSSKDESTTDHIGLPSYEGTTVSTEQSPSSMTDSTDLPSSKYEGTTILIEKSPSKDESMTDLTDPPSSKYEGATVSTEQSLSKDESSMDSHSSKYEGFIFTAVPKMEQLTIDEKIYRKVAIVKKELSDRMQLLEDKLKSKEEELGKLTKERNDLLEKLSNEKKRRDEQVEVLEREKKKLENTNESLYEEIARLKEQIRIAINQCKTLEDQVHALQQRSRSTEVENESDLEKSLCSAISSVVKKLQVKEDVEAVIVKASSKTKKDFKNSNKNCEDSNNNEQHPQSED